MRNIFIIILICIFANGYGQNPFNKTYGGSDNDLSGGIMLLDSNRYIISFTDEGFTNGPMALYVNNVGDSLNTFIEHSFFGWQKKYNKLSDSVFFTTGGYYVLSESKHDVLLQVISSNSTIMAKRYGGNDYDYGNDIELLPDSGFMIVGTTKSYGAGANDVYIIRTDKNGDTLWTRTFGNSDAQIAHGIEKQSDSVYIVAGLWANIENNAMMDAFAMQINLNGDTSNFHYYGNNHQNFGQSLCKTADGGFAIAGWSTVDYGGTYSPDGVIYKTDSNLNLQWTKYYGTIYNEDIFDIQSTYDNGFVLVGYSKRPGRGEDVYIVRTDSQGDTLWTKTLGGAYDERAYSVVQTPDSSFAVVGYTYSFGAGGSDAFFLKLKANGDITTAIGLPVEPVSSKMQIFPNPASKQATLNFGNIQSGLLTIYSTDGKILKKINVFTKESLNIDVSTLNKGIYILKFTSEHNGSLKYAKLIVQ